jgi:hypothetical protein
MSQPGGFEASIKPLFRQEDRDAMLSAFDLWSYDDVRAYSASILERLREGDMPCDGAWPDERIAAFSSWIDAGSPP